MYIVIVMANRDYSSKIIHNSADLIQKVNVCTSIINSPATNKDYKKKIEATLEKVSSDLENALIHLYQDGYFELGKWWVYVIHSDWIYWDRLEFVIDLKSTYIANTTIEVKKIMANQNSINAKISMEDFLDLINLRKLLLSEEELLKLKGRMAIKSTLKEDKITSKLSVNSNVVELNLEFL